MLPINRIILFVQNPKALSTFYQTHFNLKIITQEPNWIELQTGGATLALHKANAKKASTQNSNAKICFQVEDVTKTKAHLESQGLKFKNEFTFNDFAFADTTDPEGNALQISSRSTPAS